MPYQPTEEFDTTEFINEMATYLENQDYNEIDKLTGFSFLEWFFDSIKTVGDDDVQLYEDFYDLMTNPESADSYRIMEYYILHYVIGDMKFDLDNHLQKLKDEAETERKIAEKEWEVQLWR